MVHLAAVVGVGQSMYEIDRYVRMNTMATATFLERVVAAPRRAEQAGRRVLDVDLRRGRVRLRGARPRRRRARARGAARRAPMGVPVPGVRRELRPVPTSEAKPLIPTSVYAMSKRDHEELCLVVGAAYGVPTVALRFFNVYGPGQSLSNPYTGVAAIFASRLLNGNAPVIFEDGLQSRDFIHVSDIVEGILLALEAPDADGARINLGTGRPSTVDDVAAALARGLGVEIEPKRPGQYRAGDIRHCFADTTLANELLGFEASVTLEDGMAALVEWLREQTAEDLVDQATKRAPGARPGSLSARSTSRSSSSRRTRRSGSRHASPRCTSTRARSLSRSSSPTTSPPTVHASSWSPNSPRRESSPAATAASGTRNNRGVEATDSRYVLFLNPDTEILEGTFAELVADLDRRAGDRAHRRAPGRCRPGVCSRRSVVSHRFRGPSSRRLARSGFRCRASLAGRAGARHDSLRPGRRMRLDIGLVHAGPPRGSRERRRLRRAILHLLRGGGPLLADTPSGVGHPPHARR